jgi:hypothetical protein
MSADQEAFKAWWKIQDVHGNFERTIAYSSWFAAIDHIKQNYKLCEKKPVVTGYGAPNLYREAKP